MCTEKRFTLIGERLFRTFHRNLLSLGTINPFLEAQLLWQKSYSISEHGWRSRAGFSSSFQMFPGDTVRALYECLGEIVKSISHIWSMRVPSYSSLATACTAMSTLALLWMGDVVASWEDGCNISSSFQNIV